MGALWLQIGLYSISFGFAWGPIGWLVPSEIHDLNTRSAGQSITVFTQLVSGATVTQSKLPPVSVCELCQQQADVVASATRAGSLSATEVLLHCPGMQYAPVHLPQRAVLS